MKPAVLEGGVLTVAREAIEVAVRRKGHDLRLSISPAGLEAFLTVPTGIIDVPAKVTLQCIRVEEGRLVGENLAVSSTVFPIPLRLIGQFTSKLKFLALDAKNKRIYCDISQVLPRYLSLKIKDIELIDDGVRILVEDFSLEHIPNI
jgi:hypothetical protein